MSQAKSWVCRQCWMPTTDGPICNTCSGGRNGTPRNPAYDDPRWVRLRTRLIRDHVALHGRRCLRCPRPITQRNPLTVDHGTALATGGDLLRNTFTVMCRACNSAKGDGRARTATDNQRAGLRRRARMLTPSWRGPTPGGD